MALARAGATGRAWDAFVAAGLDGIVTQPNVLTLKGRLLKDRARAAGEGAAQAQLFLQSAKAYAGAAALNPDSYPLINAATMSLFAGQTDHMQILANQVLALMQTGVGHGETAYWHAATRAEALLLIDDIEAAKASFAKAIEHAPQAWEDHATTLRQFRQISAFRKQDYEWLSAYAPPPSLYFSGMMGLAADDMIAIEAVEEAVARTGAGFGFGALAAGADILIAEALIAMDAELHVVLPVIPSVFRAVSVDPFGAEWGERFDSLFEIATSVQIIDGGPALSMAAIEIAAQVAKGRAVDNAARMESEAIDLIVAAPGHDIHTTAQVLTLTATAPIATQRSLPAHKQSLLVAVAAGGPDEFAISEFAYIDDAEDALVNARRDDRNSTMAVSLGVDFGSEPASDARRAQIARMLGSTTKGTTTAGAEAAMALKARDSAMWIEPLGELPDAGGAINVYAIVVP